MKKLLGILVANRWLKLLSVLLAVITWVYVSEKSHTNQEGVMVPVNVTAPPDKFILRQTCKKLSLTLRGPASVMNQLRPESLAIDVNLALGKGLDMPDNYDTPQPITISILESDVRNLPPGVQVLRVQPPTVTVTLDQIDVKRLTVKVGELIGQPKKGLQIHEIYPIPRHVIVQGPRSILARRDTIQTLKVPVDNLDAGKWQPLRLLDTSDAESGLTDCLRPDRSQVELLIEVAPIEESLTLKNVPIEVRGLPGLRYELWTPEKTKLFTELAEVELKGPKAALEKPELRAYVDLTDVKKAPQKLEVVGREIQFSVAAGIQVVTRPPNVTVQIEPQPVEKP